MDRADVEEKLAQMSPEQRAELAKMMDEQLDDYMEQMEKNSSKYVDGWSEDNWEQEMEEHPFFAQKAIMEGKELSPLMQGIQDLKYSPDENTPEELAKSYKEDGNFNFKCKKYKFAVASYTEGLKHKCSDDLLNSQLLTNRAAAQFRIGNFRSALLDCRLALKKTPGHVKALARGAECCLELKRYEECTKLCDQGLKIDAKDAKFLDFRSKATKALKEAERNARREAALSKKLENEKQRLIQAIKDRGIKLKRSVGGDSDISLDALEPTFPAAVNKRVHFAEETGNNSTLVWPVLFIYPEFGETDFIEQFQEDQVFSDHVLAMFGPDVGAAPWDTEAKYVHDRIKIYFEDTERDVLVQVDTGKSLRSLVGDARYSVIGGTPSFIVLSDGSKFQKEFLGRYKKME